MATNGRSPDRTLSDRLEKNFGEFNFLQMIRLWLRRSGNHSAGLARFVRFSADLDAGFPSRAASHVQVSEIAPKPSAGPVMGHSNAAPGEPAQMMLRIRTPDFSVGSALGPLPEPFLEWMRELDRAGQPAMKDFLDLFNNRLNQLRYETRSQFEPGLNNQRPEHSQLAVYLGALMGVGSHDQVAQIPMSPRQWLGIGDFMANSRRCAAGVIQVVSAKLDCPVKLVPLIGAWRQIDPADQYKLGNSGHRLGIDTLLGRSMWDQQARVRLVLGPISYQQLTSLLPPLPTSQKPDQSETHLQQPKSHVDQYEPQFGAHASFQEVQSLLRLMLDRRHDVELELLVRKRDLPLATLAADDAGTKDGLAYAGLRLGLTAWLKSRPEPDPNDLANCSTVRFLIPAFESAPML
jgi:type VI secretion system protein ImpH